MGHRSSSRCCATWLGATLATALLLALGAARPAGRRSRARRRPGRAEHRPVRDLGDLVGRRCRGRVLPVGLVDHHRRGRRGAHGARAAGRAGGAGLGPSGGPHRLRCPGGRRRGALVRPRRCLRLLRRADGDSTARWTPWTPAVGPRASAPSTACRCPTGPRGPRCPRPWPAPWPSSAPSPLGPPARPSRRQDARPLLLLLPGLLSRPIPRPLPRRARGPGLAPLLQPPTWCDPVSPCGRSPRPPGPAPPVRRPARPRWRRTGRRSTPPTARCSGRSPT